VKRQGKGTFVNKPEVTHSLDHLSPFVAVLAAAGKQPKTRLLDFGWVTGVAVPPELGGPDASVLAFRRLYVSEGRPHALLHVRVAEPYAREIGQGEVEDTPILHLLERKHDLILRRATYTLRSTSADSQLAELLALPSGAPLLVVHRLTRTANGEPVECTTHYLRPDVYEVTVNLDEPSLLAQSTASLSLTHIVA
jgi:GntR family transcriptional regulator